ncbi:MAG: hypothetical protein ACD_19C00426G0061 [uncultured bacterium]|nr:MAG: hypothetical protein ACD_19C00426G0061 [uncultured bacterium]
MGIENTVTGRGHNLKVYSDIGTIIDSISKSPVKSFNLFFRRFRLLRENLDLTDADPNYPEPRSLVYRDDGVYQFDESLDVWKKIVNADKPISLADQKPKKR